MQVTVHLTLKGSLLKGPLSFLAVPAAVCLVALSGCDAGNDRTITGEYFNRSAGTLERASARIDSLVSYTDTFEEAPTALAGKYRDTSAFAVFKFAKPISGILDGLQDARLRLIVYDSWTEGVREFGVWDTHVNWSDTTRLAAENFLPGLGTPFATLSDTASTVSTMTFSLGDAGVQAIKSWGTTGAFLLKNTDRGDCMVNVYSSYSNSTPVLELISNTSAGLDTVRIKPVDTTYFFDTGVEGSTAGRLTGVISDGQAGGFVMHVSLPDSFSRFNAVNSGKLVIPISRNGIPSDETMHVGVSLLTAAFTTIEGAQTSTTNSFDVTVKPGDASIEVDLSTIFQIWNSVDNANHGLLFKPVEIASSPAHLVITPPDSIAVVYTTLPEVK